MIRHCEAELIALLRAEAASLQSSATAIRESLDLRASDIEDESKRDHALIDLDRYAHDYKGLIDLIVPRVNWPDWSTFVQAVRKLVREAVRRRELDSSFTGRLYRLAFKVARAA